MSLAKCKHFISSAKLCVLKLLKVIPKGLIIVSTHPESTSYDDVFKQQRLFSINSISTRSFFFAVVLQQRILLWIWGYYYWGVELWPEILNRQSGCLSQVSMQYNQQSTSVSKDEKYWCYPTRASIFCSAHTARHIARFPGSSSAQQLYMFCLFQFVVHCGMLGVIRH